MELHQTILGITLDFQPAYWDKVVCRVVDDDVDDDVKKKDKKTFFIALTTKLSSSRVTTCHA